MGPEMPKRAAAHRTQQPSRFPIAAQLWLFLSSFLLSFLLLW